MINGIQKFFKIATAKSRKIFMRQKDEGLKVFATRQYPWQKTSVATRLFKVIFASYFIVTLIVTLLQLGLEYSHVKRDLVEDLQSLAATFKPGITEAVWSYNNTALNSILFGMMKLDSIVGVKIADQEQKIIRAMGEDGKSAMRSSGDSKFGSIKNLTLFFDKEIYTSSIPLTYVDFKGDEHRIGYLSVYSDSKVVFNKVKYGFILIVINSVIKTTALWIIFIYFVNRIVLRRLFSLTETVKIYENVDHGNQYEVLKEKFKEMGLAKVQDEIGLLSWNFSELFSSLGEARKKLMEQEKLAGIMEISSQVAHDIRSPLAALDTAVKQTADMSEENRILIRSAVQRIRDIANDLSLKKRNADVAKPDSKYTEESSVQLLSGIIDGIVSEKRLQYRDRISIEIESDLGESSYGLFASVQLVEFKRVLSNLINNAVEALNGNGKVEVKLLGDENIAIQIRDSGKGIPAEILPKLMRRGETHGKSGGSGLGLYHARTSVEKWGGGIEIQSVIGTGTTIAVTLPKAQFPSWFVGEVNVPEKCAVVVIDDDDSIHQIWKRRLEKICTNYGVSLSHFASPEEFIAWQRKTTTTGHILYLCDYEFLNHDKTGLDVIRELGIAGNAILVTSHFEENDVRVECEKLGVRLIPKNLAGFVPITTNNVVVLIEPLQEIKASAGEIPHPPDAILIDDDDLVHINWKMAAKRKNKIVRVYAGPDEFWKESELFSKNTPIYVDSNLAGGVKGEDISRMMGKKGFSNLHLATGCDASQFDEMPWLKSIVGKNPPWA
ncbi:MAG: hybrid sensor histidine kinase/response regulator [Pseudomonadota bacterium]